MASNAASQDLVLVDLLSQRHHMVQKSFENEWNDKSNITITNSEWNVMARIYNLRLPVSKVTRSVTISRQAIHKLIKNLSKKGLIEIYKMENNKKERWIMLTDFGKECYEEHIALKLRLEEKITKELGADKVKTLKDILQLDWGN